MKKLNSKIHGIVDYAVIIFLWLSPIALVAVAFVLGNIDGNKSMIFYLFMAVAIFVTWVITDNTAASAKGSAGAIPN